LVSHFPGRLRVRAETFRVLPEVAEEVCTRLAEEHGVKAVKTSPLTGSLLVTYEPRELQLPRVIQLLIRVGGLHGLEVDSAEQWTQPARGGRRVREGFDGVNEALRGATRGNVMFWSFVIFQNLNPREGGREGGTVRRNDDRGRDEDAEQR
jgi:hypothetical protein